MKPTIKTQLNEAKTVEDVKEIEGIEDITYLFLDESISNEERMAKLLAED